MKILPLAMVDDITAISYCGIDSLLLNSYINTKMELKKLKFHTPDVNGKSKCHKIHIGSRNSSCPVLKVHGSQMESVSEDDYLGDVITADGKNKKNIRKRISRGVGIISELMNILKLVSFGQNYIEIALMLRNSIFLSSVLNNVEVIYDISKCEMKEFDDLDIKLLRKLLNSPITTPKEAYYLELGVLPPSVHVKINRIKYLHYLLSKSKTEMLAMFFWTQWRSPCKGD